MPEQEPKIYQPSTILKRDAEQLSSRETITVQLSEEQCKHIANALLNEFKKTHLQDGEFESTEIRALRWLFEELTGIESEEL